MTKKRYKKPTPETLRLGKLAHELHGGGPKKGGLSWDDVAVAMNETRAKLRMAAYAYRTHLNIETETKSDAGETTGGNDVEQDGNILVATYTYRGDDDRPRINTLEELTAFCNINTDEWQCIDFTANSYEVVVKDKRQHLTYIDGKASGEISAHGPVVVPVFQIKARFVRRQLVALEPCLQPVIASPAYQYPAPTYEVASFTRRMILADQHFGFVRTGPISLTPMHDRRALDITVQIAEEIQPDYIDILGDLLDMAEASDKFITSPDYRQLLQPAMLAAHHYLARLRSACPNSIITVHQGNHDERLERSTIKHLPWAYKIQPAMAATFTIPALGLENLLSLDDLGINYIGDYPRDHDWQDGTCLLHGNYARKGPGDTAKAMVTEYDHNTIFGHIHRKERATRTVRSGRGRTDVITAVTFGCLCRTDGTVPGDNGNNWQKGLGIIDFANGVQLAISDITILDGMALYDGKLYTGQEIVPEEVKEWGG